MAGRLKSLRSEGVLIIGSGNMVHNLAMMEWTDKPFDWAVDFDQQLKKLIEARNAAALIDYPRLGPNAELAIPTNEHYLPMLYALAVTDANEPLRFFADELTLGSISMRCFQIG
jgi:4,5-DOPA dioxygenase extradiol